MTQNCMRRLLGIVALAGVTACSANCLASGRIIVMSDEWPLSNANFGAPHSAPQFARNAALWLNNGTTGSFLVYSSNFGLTQSLLAAEMTGAGHSWTVSTAQPFSLALLQQYDGVYLAGRVGGQDLNNQVLIDYVSGGGSVYLSTGCGTTGGYGGSAPLEAAAWNPFLNHFGLALHTTYNVAAGAIVPTVNDTHPIFQGVGSLGISVGQGILDLEPASENNKLWVPFVTGGVTYGRVATVIPGPGAIALTLVGLPLGLRRRR